MENEYEASYRKAGYLVALGLGAYLLVLMLVVTLVTTGRMSPTGAFYEAVVAIVGLPLLLLWFAAIGCYAVASGKTRGQVYLRVCLFPPYLAFAAVILYLNGRGKAKPPVSLRTVLMFVLRAAIGWD